MAQAPRETLIANYIMRQKELATLKERHAKVQNELEDKLKLYAFSEQANKSIDTIANKIGDVHQKLDDERILVKVSGSRVVVGCRPKLDRALLKPGTRVTLDQQTFTIMSILPREVDFNVHKMQVEGPEANCTFGDVGGLTNQIRDLKETIELPLTNPELFGRLGIKPPKGVLLYGPPGTGKTLLARTLAAQIDAKFIKVVASAIVDKYIGESSRQIREMFQFARDNQPAIIFIDEVDAIGSKRMNDSSSADREIQRTLMELLNQLDGFDDLGKVKCVMATNRPDTLDPALLRPGRMDRKIEIPLPNEQGRLDIIKIHAKEIAKSGDIDFEAIAKFCEDFNGADMRCVCTEAGMFAIRHERDYCTHDDFMKAARKLKENKKLESKIHYGAV